MTSRATRSFEPIQPSAYLAIAMQLAETPDAAAQRSAVDRAYYAAFLTVHDGLVDKGYASFPERPEAHRRVAEALNALTEDMGQRLAILRRARNASLIKRAGIRFLAVSLFGNYLIRLAS